MSNIDWDALRQPFAASDVEWRIQRSGIKNNNPWAMVLCYVTNRAIQDRLDTVIGPANWKNEFTTGPIGGVLCGISIKIDNEWVTKWDGADKSNMEAIKGGFSGAMKRAAVQWGIGRYLYNLEAGWAKFSQDGQYSSKIENKHFNWSPPQLPAWALPKQSSSKTPPNNQKDTKGSTPDKEKEKALYTLTALAEARGLTKSELDAALHLYATKGHALESAADLGVPELRSFYEDLVAIPSYIVDNAIENRKESK